MRSVNKVIIIGNLTRAPELRSTPSGQQVATFGVATNRDWTTREGSKKSSAEFHECVAWAKLAEICEKHLQKGTFVYIEGYLKTRNWDGEDGNKRFKTEIVVQELTILSKRNHEEGDGEKEEYVPTFSASADNADTDHADTDYSLSPPNDIATQNTPEDNDDPINRDLGL